MNISLLMVPHLHDCTAIPFTAVVDKIRMFDIRQKRLTIRSVCWVSKDDIKL